MPMKPFKSAAILIILALGTLTAYSNTAVIGSMWKQIGSILHLADDVTGADFAGKTITGLSITESDPIAKPIIDNHTGTDPHRGIFPTISTTGNIKVGGTLDVNGDTTLVSGKYLRADPQTSFLEYDNVAGFFETYTTEGVFYRWQNNIASKGVFGNVSASVSTGEITILAGGDGRYQIHRDTGVHGEPNTNYSFAISVNGSPVAQSHTSPGTPPESFPAFAHLSSFAGTATFNDNSSLSFLFYADNDQVKIVEAGSGNGVDEWCFEYDIWFNLNHVPHFLKLGNGQYIGGANHYADALAFDNLSSRWTNLREAAEDIKNVGSQADYKNSTLKFAFPNDGSQTRYILNGVVKTRVRHNDGVVCSSGHEYWIDEAKIEDLLGVISDSGTVEVALIAGDVVTIGERPRLADKFFHRHRTRLSITRIGN